MKRSKRYTSIKEGFDKSKKYTINEAIDILKAGAKVKFDESVEIAIRLGIDPKKSDQMIRGAATLPHGTGKTVRILVFAAGDKAKEAQEAGADFVFFAHEVSDLREEDRHFTLTDKEIELINPNTKTCPIFRSKRDAEITKDVYNKVGQIKGENVYKWNYKLGTLFHSSNDVGRFIETSELINDGWQKDKTGILSFNRKKAYRLYEGKMFNIFDHRAGTVTLSDTALIRQRQTR